MQNEQAVANRATKILLGLLDLTAVLLLMGLVGAQADIMPIEPPTLQAKTIHTLTADERSEILMYEIRREAGLERVKTGAAFDSVTSALIEPVGWLAYVSQDAVVDAPGVAYAYGGM